MIAETMYVQWDAKGNQYLKKRNRIIAAETDDATSVGTSTASGLLIPRTVEEAMEANENGNILWMDYVEKEMGP